MRRDRRHSRMPLAGDQRFHLRAAEASGNRALALAVPRLWAQRTGPLFLRLERHFDTPALWDDAIREHERLLAAIAARAAMRRHLAHAVRRYKGSFGRQPFDCAAVEPSSCSAAACRRRVNAHVRRASPSARATRSSPMTGQPGP